MGAIIGIIYCQPIIPEVIPKTCPPW